MGTRKLLLILASALMAVGAREIVGLPIIARVTNVKLDAEGYYILGVCVLLSTGLTVLGLGLMLLITSSLIKHIDTQTQTPTQPTTTE